MKPDIIENDGSVSSNRALALKKRREAVDQKYAEAVKLYAETNLSLKQIAVGCGLSPGAFGNYLRRNRRELVLRRYNVSADGASPDAVKLLSPGTQSVRSHEKYGKAIAACDSLEFIELNVSQIAHMFNLSGTALTNYMRVHYEEIPVRREKIRQRLGLSDNIHHGVREVSESQYAEAVRLYRDTEMTLSEVAAQCQVSERGLSQHLRFYHKEVLDVKRGKRKEAQAVPKKARGALLGNGRRSQPSPMIERKYAEALALYRDTPMTMKAIVEKTGVSKEGFRFYLHKWHMPLVLAHSGLPADTPEGTDLRRARLKMKSVAAKYAGVIESLKQNPRPLKSAATEYGFDTEVLRQYVHKHEPELAHKIGLITHNSEHKALIRSVNKYKEALQRYASTTDSLRSIAVQFGLNYKSLSGFVYRNGLDAAAAHKALVNKKRDAKK